MNFILISFARNSLEIDAVKQIYQLQSILVTCEKTMNKKLLIYGVVGLLAGSAVTAVAITRSSRTQHQVIIPPASTSMTSNPHTGHSMNMPEGSVNVQGKESHVGHSTSNTGNQVQHAIAQAKLTAPTNITLNTPVSLVIDVQDSTGRAITKFDRFQEKLMHLIIVSDNLQFFNHVHPTYKENGRFETETRFLQPGTYTLFTDYKPAGKTEQVSVLKTQVPGTSPLAPKIDLNRTKTFAGTKANLTFSQPSLKAGQEVTLMFTLRESSNNQLLTDLQPYLGEQGHLVIIKQSSPLTEANYIHAHALKNTPTGQVNFMTLFPEPGKYKLWGQFNRNGEIVVADFWVNVL